MSSPRQSIYVNGDFSEPMSAQYNFANQFDLENPEQARMSYQKLMHEHTKQQFELAASSARRRASPHEHQVPSMNYAGSTSSSVDSA